MFHAVQPKMWILIYMHLVALHATTAVARIANSSTPRTTSLPAVLSTVSSTGSFCCQLFVQSVSLNVWYTSSLNYTKNIVVTKYAQYNDTVVRSTIITAINNGTDTISYGTRSDIEPSQYTFSAIPNIIGSDGFGYDGTAVDSTTVWHNNYTTAILTTSFFLYRTSPTPFAIISSIYFATGRADGTNCIASAGVTITSTMSITTKTISPLPISTGTISAYTTTITEAPTTLRTTLITDSSVGPSDFVEALFEVLEDPYYGPMLTPISISQPFVYFPGLDHAQNWTYGGPLQDVEPPSELLSWLKNLSEVVSQFPKIGLCSPGGGLGAPTLHIPVAELTVYSDTTVPVGGNYGDNRGQSGERGGSSSGNGGYGAHTEREGQGGRSGGGNGGSDSSRSSNLGGSRTLNDPAPGAPPTIAQPPATESPDSLFAAIPATIQLHNYHAASSGESSLTGSISWNVAIPSSRSAAIAASTPHSSQPLDAVVVGAKTVSSSIPAQSANLWTVSPHVMIGSLTATPAELSAFGLPGGQGITAGGPSVTISGTTYALAASGAVVVNGQTVSTLPFGVLSFGRVSFGTIIATAVSSGTYVFSDETISVDGPPVTISGSEYSLSPSDATIINGHTFSTISAPLTTGPVSAITLGNKAEPLETTRVSGLIVNGQNLYPGGSPITIDANGHAETLSLPRNGILPNGDDILILNGQTQTFPSGHSVTTEANGATLTLSRTNAEGLVIGGKTIVSGGSALETEGALVSVASNGVIVEFSEGQTSTIGDADGNSIAGYIISGIGGATKSANANQTNAPQVFTGASSRKDRSVGGETRFCMIFLGLFIAVVSWL
ncbi:MAG: hypothetical protein M1820_001490 [Bogoriella megaspora]|nr:MAG: hypothetical protein M1820_001490 [Bogoriella megaspora]